MSWPNTESTKRAIVKDIPAITADDSAAKSLDPDGVGDDILIGATAFNLGPNTAYIGGSDTGSTIGVPVASGASMDLIGLPSQNFARCSTGQTAEIRTYAA
jgi:hypothetical protein